MFICAKSDRPLMGLRHVYEILLAPVEVGL
jgi:hypothetical protein